MTVLLAVLALGGGLWVLVESVERLVGILAAWAGAAGMSGLVLSALVLGLDLEATAAGVAATLDDLPGTALGTAVGGVLFLVTFGLGLAAVVAPFAVRTPRRLLAAAAGATAVACALLGDGRLSRADGGLLLAAWAVCLAVVASAGRGTMPRSGAGRPPRLALRLAGGLAGVVVGAELLVLGTGGLVEALGVSETLFGLLVIGAAVSFEEVVLELLPAQRGHPEISVGNALGTLVFLLTGSLGVIALAAPLDVPAAVPAYHLPALGLGVGVVLLLLARGRMGRPEGLLLLGLYPVYVAGAVLA